MGPERLALIQGKWINGKKEIRTMCRNSRERHIVGVEQDV